MYGSRCRFIISTGEIIAALYVARPANEEFSNLVYRKSPGGNTGESYAVRESGLLLSESRFEDELISSGLVTNPKFGGVLSLMVKDPGKDFSVTQTIKNRESWRLTKAAQTISYYAAGRNGYHWNQSVEPYRDYRGVEVIGAYAWLPGYTALESSQKLTKRKPLCRSVMWPFHLS